MTPPGMGQKGKEYVMGDMADYALDQLSDEDEAQMETLGYSNVFQTRNPEPTECTVCHGPLVARQGPHGAFLGCAAFPKCRGTTYSLVNRQNELSEHEKWLMEQ